MVERSVDARQLVARIDASPILDADETVTHLRRRHDPFPPEQMGVDIVDRQFQLLAIDSHDRLSESELNQRPQDTPELRQVFVQRREAASDLICPN